MDGRVEITRNPLKLLLEKTTSDEDEQKKKEVKKKKEEEKQKDEVQKTEEEKNKEEYKGDGQVIRERRRRRKRERRRKLRMFMKIKWSSRRTIKRKRRTCGLKLLEWLQDIKPIIEEEKEQEVRECTEVELSYGKFTRLPEQS